MDIIRELKKQGVSEKSLFCDFSGFVQQNSWEKLYQDLTSDDYLDRALEAHQSDNYKEAVKYCNKAINRDSDNINAYFVLGYIKGQAKDFYGARDNFGEIIRISPQHYDAHCYRAAAKVELKDYRGAINDYSTAIGINSTAAAHYSRGLIHYHLGEYTEADRDYQKAISFATGNPYFVPYNTIQFPQNKE